MATQLTDTDNQYWEVDSVEITAVPLTIAFWGLLDGSVSNDHCGVQLSDLSETSHYFRLGSNSGDGFVKAAAGDGGVNFARSTVEAGADVWHHYCGVYTAVDSRAAFLDGTAKGTDANSRTPAGIDRTSVGREGDSSPGDEWDGRLAEVAIWSVALTDAEVFALGNGVPVLRVRPDQLVNYWPFMIGTSGIDYIGTTNLTGNGDVLAPTHGNHAPVSPMFGYDLGWQGAFGAAAPPSGRTMGSLAGLGGLAGHGGIAGKGGGIAA